MKLCGIKKNTVWKKKRPQSITEETQCYTVKMEHSETLWNKKEDLAEQKKTTVYHGGNTVLHSENETQ